MEIIYFKDGVSARLNTEYYYNDAIEFIRGEMDKTENSVCSEVGNRNND